MPNSTTYLNEFICKKYSPFAICRQQKEGYETNDFTSLGRASIAFKIVIPVNCLQCVEADTVLEKVASNLDESIGSILREATRSPKVA